MKALLLITFQNDFCSFGNAAIDFADTLIEKANMLMPFFDKVLAVNFAFPPNHVSFAANHLFRQPGKTMQINGRNQLLKPIHCVNGSFGAAFPKGLQVDKIDYLQEVGTNAEIDIYSMFRDADDVENNLPEYLKTTEIKEIYFMGICSNFFYNSIKDTELQGFNTKIVGDACVGDCVFDRAKATSVSALITA